jgi:hypothetical protein
MGINFADQFSYLHFVVGATVFYFNIPLFQWVVLHTLFEILENSPKGVYFINTYLTFWPGGKPKADTLINNVGDTVFAILGWFSSLLVNYYSKSTILYFN